MYNAERTKRRNSRKTRFKRKERITIACSILQYATTSIHLVCDRGDNYSKGFLRDFFILAIFLRS